MNMNSIKAGLAAALVSGAMLASPVMAEEAMSIEVRYSDLDLSTQEGQDSLERRLNRAAEQVCGINPRVTGVALPSTESRRCYRETVEQFERQIATIAERQQRG